MLFKKQLSRRGYPLWLPLLSVIIMFSINLTACDPKEAAPALDDVVDDIDNQPNETDDVIDPKIS